MVSKPRSVQSSRWDGAIFLIIPSTSCLATVVLSLRDKIHSNADISLAQWMGLLPSELVKAHLNVDDQFIANLPKDEPLIR
jgi:hypothetical protein